MLSPVRRRRRHVSTGTHTAYQNTPAPPHQIFPTPPRLPAKFWRLGYRSLTFSSPRPRPLKRLAHPDFLILKIPSTLTIIIAT
jgi:hypothetical protein